MSNLIEIKIDDKLLFLDNNHVWKFEGNNGVYDIGENNYIMFVLPLLEYDFEEIKTKIPIQYLELLPIIKLLKFPFDNEMKYWADLALIWVEKGNYKSEMQKWAKDLKVDWMPQKLKHRFWKTMGIRSYFYLPPSNSGNGLN